ncbi:hypothetical protein M758_4G175700 [Ceratodon purpureus]|uniref:Uncharacterized protein n=1 Tax=Ceratodon purpureus TaxID=3225 RepID=A0A8T0IBS6_CERPU|nr:hypothetical protein KC19_4G173800 [Ceratodon purpureus]KAG0619924.1 hypothetical protein M758_4G175700 [Ceratodon purpureus]
MASNVPKLPIGSEEGGEEAGKGSRPSRASRVSRASTTGSRTDSSKRRNAGMGLYEPPSYEEQQRKYIRVEKVSRIIAGMDLTPRVFAGSGEVEPKLWQESATSLQSPMIVNLKKSLQQRKKKMKIFTANPNFQDYFYVPKGPEYRPMPSIIESTMGSKEEVVGREVIHKTALKQLRCHLNDFHNF